MTALRTLIVLATWPLAWAIDKARGINPPARFATGMHWARTGERQDR